MRILHILNTASFSGAENVAITIIKNMSAGNTAAYASLDGSIKNKLIEEGVEFLPIKKMNPKVVNSIIKDYEPDIIHAHDFTTSIISALTTTKIPIISHLHNNVPWLKKYHVYSFLYLMASQRFEKVLGVSDAIFDEYVFSESIRNKTQVVSNPINVEDIKLKADKGEKKQYDIIFLGRLTEQKNPIRFIELMGRLKNDIPNFKVAIIGTGELGNICKNKISNLNLEKNIELLGFMNNPYGILSHSTVLCMTSDWEGFGLVAVEALSLGVPVVATPVGGLLGIVNEDCGLLTFDDEAYIDEVKRIILDNGYRRSKSEFASLRAYELDNVKEYISALENLYEEVMGRKN